jgi:hypothetical protein
MVMSQVDDDLNLLAADLRALSPRQRRDVFAALNSFERMSVRALLDETGESAARFAHFSSPIAKCLRGIEGAGEAMGATPVTEPTRRLVVQLATEAEAMDFEVVRAAGSRGAVSLISAIGGWLSGSRAAQ